MRIVFTLGAAVIVGLLMIPMGSAQAATPLTVCVGAGGTLRLLDKNSACKAGEQKKLFAEWEPEEPEPKEADEEEGLKNQITQLSKRLAALEKPEAPTATRTQVDLLERRLAALETKDSKTTKNTNDTNTRIPNRVTAPFEVVAPDGTIILRVAQKVGHETGGGARVTIGGGEPGNYAVRVHDSKGGKVVAGIGQGKFNHDVGVVVALDDDGDVGASMDGNGEIAVLFAKVVKASMRAEYARGIVGVYEGDDAVAFLTKSSGGDGGNVTVSLNNGFGVFSAGAAQDGGGEACVNRVTGGGQQRRACLGIELPSMGLGK
ncbi:MAG: hypothetical protein K8S25_10420 [Alphaproteobacteria bacterium]|nr:hypothetical protein [Alphaproteobacteria bacterium]